MASAINFHAQAARRRTGALPNAPASSSTKREVALWLTQGLLAAIFLFAGLSKLVLPAADLADQSDLPVRFLRFIGGAETLGAIGLILPWWLGIRRWLTPVAAAGLVIIMAGATVVTIANEGPGLAIIPLVVGLLAAVVLIARRSQLQAAVR